MTSVIEFLRQDSTRIPHRTDLLCMKNWGTQWSMVSYFKKSNKNENTRTIYSNSERSEQFSVTEKDPGGRLGSTS